jgi:hypothetical protein
VRTGGRNLMSCLKHLYTSPQATNLQDDLNVSSRFLYYDQKASVYEK